MIIGASVVHNDSHVFVRTLKTFEKLCDEIVVLDDGSDSITAQGRTEEISSIFTKPFTFERIEKSPKEYIRRSYLWKMLCNGCRENDWIVLLDSDECLHDKEIVNIKNAMTLWRNDSHINFISLRLYNMWEENKFRVDGYWNPRFDLKRRIFKLHKSDVYMPNNYTPDTIECGEVPKYVFSMAGKHTNYKLLHYGYARAEDRVRKYNFHKEVDAEGKFHLNDHIESILQHAVLEELR